MTTKVTNIAQLKLRKGTANALVSTLGYYTASDGGGNTYQWNNSSVLSDYEYLKASLKQVSEMLSLFQFQGVLSGFQLIIDETVLDEIIADLTPVVTPPVE